MELIIHQQESSWKTLTTSAISMAISPDFQDHKPQYFGAPPARSETYKNGSFTGDTRQGGSCNVREIHIIPHCHGTHTEDIGHICHESPGVLNTLQDSLFLMLLLSLPPVPAASCGESYQPVLSPTDQVLTKKNLQDSMNKVRLLPDLTVEGLAIRSLVGAASISSFHSEQKNLPFFTHEAMAHISNLGFRHLLTDLPSVDRSNDEGRMTNHRIFWGLEGQSREYSDARYPERTITEMIRVPEHVADGLYLANLRISPFLSDACPSSPLIYPLELL
ncbi:MAG: cyclase family protein [Deltaproteobacteria bacterium]|nr:cyclase family protein [Deltaproteobacteria bacterium]